MREREREGGGGGGGEREREREREYLGHASLVFLRLTVDSVSPPTLTTRPRREEKVKVGSRSSGTVRGKESCGTVQFSSAISDLLKGKSSKKRENKFVELLSMYSIAQDQLTF